VRNVRKETGEMTGVTEDGMTDVMKDAVAAETIATGTEGIIGNIYFSCKTQLVSLSTLLAFSSSIRIYYFQESS